MSEIKYELHKKIQFTCLTECKIVEDAKVGSDFCITNCENFLSHSRVNQIIKCKKQQKI